MSPKRRVTIDYPEFPLTLRNLRLGLAGRLGRPYTQEQLAKKVRVTRSHIANVEGAFMPASPSLIFRIAEFYDIDPRIVRKAYDATRVKVASPETKPKRKKAK
jgi:transcriptional regulator with XRE-family HTH domain